MVAKFLVWQIMVVKIARMLNNGRCTFNPNVCMDYNGWFTDCVNGKVSNFPGSDCDTAMGRGECWNEIM